MSRAIGEGKGRTCEVTIEVIFRFSGSRSGLGVVRLLSPPSRALCGCCRVRCTGRSFVRVGPSRRPRIDPRALAAALLLLQLLPCCRCCLLWVVAVAIQLRALTVVTLFVFFSASTRHTRVVGPSVVPRTTAFRKNPAAPFELRCSNILQTFLWDYGSCSDSRAETQRDVHDVRVLELFLAFVVCCCVQVNQLLHVWGYPRNDDLRTWRGRRGL